MATDDASGTTASVAAVSPVKIGEADATNATHSTASVIGPSSGVTPSGKPPNILPAVTVDKS